MKLRHKLRPRLSDCGVMPLDRKVHYLLLSSYLMWLLTICIGNLTTGSVPVLNVLISFSVLGLFFYNLLVSMYQMSHEPKKRLRTGRWIFWVSLSVLVLRLVFL